MSLADKHVVVIMAGKYQLYKDKAGKYRFRLVAENGRTIVAGEAYARRTSCLKGIESVKKNSGSSIEDTTILDSPKIPFPKYQILVDKAGEFRFNLSASNGEVIASSEGYSSKEGCLNGIKSVKRIGNSEIEDLTIAAEKHEEAPIIEPEPAVVQREVQEKQKESPIIEPEPVVIQKEVEPSKIPEPEETYQEENKKIPIPAVATTAPKEITTDGNEVETKQKGISIIALAVLAIGLVVGVILLAVGLGYGGIFGAADGLAKAVALAFGVLVISLSIIVFFAKK